MPGTGFGKHDHYLGQSFYERASHIAILFDMGSLSIQRPPCCLEHIVRWYPPGHHPPNQRLFPMGTICARFLGRGIDLSSDPLRGWQKGMSRMDAWLLLMVLF
jgi:hypothetical protein